MPIGDGRTRRPSERKNFHRVGWQRRADPISCTDVHTVRGVASLAAMAVAVVALLPGGASEAATTLPKPSLSAEVAEATKLSNEVDSLGQQYDELQIQMSHASMEERLSKLAAARADKAVHGSQ